MSHRWLRVTWLVIQRELRQRGRSRGFAISTAILVLIVGAGVAIPAVLAHGHRAETVGIVGSPLAALKRTVLEAGRISGESVTVVQLPSRAAAVARLRAGGMAAVLVEGREVLVRQLSFKASTESASTLVASLSEVGGLSRLFAKLPPGTRPPVTASPALPVRGLFQGTASLTSRVTGLAAVVVIYVLILAYGWQIAIGVGEEKWSRVVEVLLAAMRPVQLLAGKVIGIGILASLQAAIMVATFIGLGAALGSTQVHAAGPVVAVGGVWYVLGYAFYCTAFAAAGSLSSRQAEVGNSVAPLQVFLPIAYILSFTVLYANAANPFFWILGYFPPTAPVAMTVLYASGLAPLWKVGLSAAISILATALMARLTGRIYQRSILRTGPRVRLRQALRRESAPARLTWA